MGWLARLMGVLGFAFALAHCSSSSSEDRVCDPGRQVSCPCPGGAHGIQKCSSDGNGYSLCECGDAATEGGAGTGGSNTGGSGGGSTGGGGASAGAGGTGGSAGDASTSCAPGTATDITGSCDLVLQDCAAGLTCAIEQNDAGAIVSACLDLGDGPKKLGESCANHGDCAAGLVCALASCTHPCCPDLEAQQCGATGACDMQITYSSGFVQICTYSPPCTPWTNDCPPGPESDCHVGSGGKLKCSFPNYDPDGGSTLGDACQYLNDCADSQQCDYSGGSGVCRWLCKASDTGAPDAGVVGGTPGNGGCPAGQTCVAYANPSWLGVCRP